MKWQKFERPGHLVNRAARLSMRYADLRLGDVGRVASLRVLQILRDGDMVTQKQLALCAQIEQPSMAQLLNRLERDGMITRTPDPSDGRASLIGLTDKAQAALPRVDAIVDGFNDQAVKGMSPAEVETLIRLLKQMIANLEDDAGDSPQNQPNPR